MIRPPALPGRMYRIFIFLLLREHGLCHIKNEKEAAPRVQKNGAVSEDCAEPHENPNLTLLIQTAQGEICSNGKTSICFANSGVGLESPAGEAFLVELRHFGGPAGCCGCAPARLARIHVDPGDNDGGTRYYRADST